MQREHVDEDYSVAETEIDGTQLEIARQREIEPQAQTNPERRGKPAIVFKDLGYRVTAHEWKRDGCSLHREPKETTILQGVTGSLCYGEVVALMGGSGAGKSSLLDLLACRKDACNVVGDIRYDGVVRQRLLSSDAGYVVQSDMAMPNLTVFETLMFAAKFQLTTSDEEKTTLINSLLRELRLEHVANTRVGSSLDRGISGGEFRRLAIGECLLTSPKILFLDEPTSGLDSASAMVVVSLLRKLAQTRNQLIVVSIHQPSPALLEKFDTVVVLSKCKSDRVGRMAYIGPVADIPRFPPELGLPVPRQFSHNVLEFIMEISTRQNVNQAIDEAILAADAETGDAWQCPTTELAQLWRDSGRGRAVLDHTQQIFAEFENPSEASRAAAAAAAAAEETAKPGRYPTSRWLQFTTFSHRLVLNTYRQPGFWVSRFGVPHIIGGFLSSLYARIGNSDQDIQNTVSLVFFSLLVCFVMSQVFLPLFIILRPLVSRERQGRLYSASAMVFGTILPNLPIEIINWIAFATYTYWIVGLRIDGWYWFCFVVNLVGNGFLLTFFMMLCSSISPTPEVALAIAPILFMFWLMFSGFFVLIETIPVWYRYWAPYISPLRYALAAGMYTQFAGVSYADCADCTNYETGNDVLDYYGVPIGNDAGLWGYIGIVYLFAAFFLFLIYLANRNIRWVRG